MHARARTHTHTHDALTVVYFGAQADLHSISYLLNSKGREMERPVCSPSL